MGRESVATCQWQGQIAEVRLHLDSKEFTLRGDIRATLPRASLQQIDATEDGLRLLSNGEELRIELPVKDAAAWIRALKKSPPTLAEKLGVNTQAQAFVLGACTDETLHKALEGNTTNVPEDAAILLAILETEDDLTQAIALAQKHPDKHLWCVYRKGKPAVGDTLVRTRARAMGLIDSKTSAVSDTYTATRYRMR